MKKSNYNIIVEHDDKILAFNSMTCALAEVSGDFMDVLNDIDNNAFDPDRHDKELIDNMLLGNYIVNDVVDELKVVKFKNLHGKYSSKGMGMTIAPTLACNFACPYCYETPKKGMMSKEIQDKLVCIAETGAKQKKHISITWYGGEPLLAVGIIVDMSKRMIEIAEKYEVEYSAFMVTNGYLLDEATLKTLMDVKVLGYQITVDGPPDIHNLRRKLKKGSDPTFDRIMDSIKLASDAGITNLSVRVNVDKSNTDRLEELLDILIAEGLQEKVNIGLGHVNAYTEACASVADGCLSVEEYAIETLGHQTMMHGKGFIVKDFPYYPGIKANYCCADSMGSHVIDPLGYMYKCWNDVGIIEKAVGNVMMTDDDVDEAMYMKNIEYMFWSPFDFEECVNCNVLPICMGGCPHNGLRGAGKPQCEKWKYNLDKALLLAYEQRQQPVGC
jgi:uncharacterized protein